MSRCLFRVLVLIAPCLRRAEFSSATAARPLRRLPMPKPCSSAQTPTAMAGRLTCSTSRSPTSSRANPTRSGSTKSRKREQTDPMSSS